MGFCSAPGCRQKSPCSLNLPRKAVTVVLTQCKSPILEWHRSASWLAASDLSWGPKGPHESLLRPGRASRAAGGVICLYLGRPLSVQQLVSGFCIQSYSECFWIKTHGLFYPLAADIFPDFLLTSFSESLSSWEGPCMNTLLSSCSHVWLLSPIQGRLPGRVPSIT